MCLRQDLKMYFRFLFVENFHGIYVFYKFSTKTRHFFEIIIL